MATGIRAANPIWYFVDLIGQGLNDQYYISFLTNTFPYLPQPVYHDVNLTIPWTNPLQFYPNGTLPDNMYWNPSLVYRLEIRQGPTQSDPLIYEINNFQPGQGNITPNNLDIVTASNQITNPQFAEVYFTNDLVITAAGTYHIAPGWDLIISGAGGTTTVTQVVLSGLDSAGSPIVIGNPPFAIKIDNAGWTNVTLEQRFNNNGALWQNGAVSGLILAKTDNSPETITMNYVESDSGRQKEIFSHQFTTANFQFFGGAVNVDNNPVASNTDLSTVAYTNIDLVLPTTGIVYISNVQVTGQTLPLPVNPLPFDQLPAYDQETIERNIDHQFHVYKPQLFYKPIPSHLVGWDFPLNPAQFLGSTIAPQAIGANKSYYAWDQTIIFQSANSGFSISRGIAEELVLTANVISQGAIIQYLPQIKAREILEDFISVYLSATTTAISGLDITVSLWYTTDVSLPSTVLSNNSLVLTLDSNGKPATFNGTWKEVPPLNGQNNTAHITSSTNASFNDYSFNGWSLNGSADATTATFFAIVIGTKSIAIGDTLRISSVGLNSGHIATIPAAQTPDEVLRECQYYYEKSYISSVIPGTASLPGAKLYQMLGTQDGGGNPEGLARAFEINFKTVKNTAPSIVQVYSPVTGTAANIRSYLFNGGSQVATGDQVLASFWSTFISASVYNISLTAKNVTPIASFGAVASFPECFITLHYVADSRLGY